MTSGAPDAQGGETDSKRDLIPGGQRSPAPPRVISHALTALTGFEIFCAYSALLLWFLLFCGGSLLSTDEYRARLLGTGSWLLKVKPLIVCLGFWTTTNVGLLSCLSAFLGAVGARCRFTTALDPNSAVQPPTEGVRSVLLTNYLAAVMRGFGVYTLSMAGLIFLARDSVTQPAQDTYLRLAPLISIVGFYSGFNPQTFAGLLGRVQTLLRTDDSRGSSASKGSGNAPKG